MHAELSCFLLQTLQHWAWNLFPFMRGRRDCFKDPLGGTGYNAGANQWAAAGSTGRSGLFLPKLQAAAAQSSQIFLPLQPQRPGTSPSQIFTLLIAPKPHIERACCGYCRGRYKMVDGNYFFNCSPPHTHHHHPQLVASITTRAPPGSAPASPARDRPTRPGSRNAPSPT